MSLFSRGWPLYFPTRPLHSTNECLLANHQSRLTEYVDDETQGEPSLAVEDFLEPDPAPFASKNWHYADAQTTRLDEEGKSSH